ARSWQSTTQRQKPGAQMTTATIQRERLTQLARSRKPGALVAKAARPIKKLASMRLFDKEMQEADALAG
ncbi:hypothetical protein, partial [Comamonas sp. B-9]|uniref:hypothetical protein n=1 Tax=Comamonas sp. B-9 TaxID=1055192 RepID=UPI00130E76F5